MANYCDLEQISANFEGDEDILAELVQDFKDSLDDMIGEMESSLSANDMELLERSSHTIKGVISNFFCENLRVVSQSIETKSKDGNTDGVSAEIQTLREEVPKMIAELEEFCNKANAA